MSKVVLQGHIIVPAQEFQKIQSALVKHIKLTRQEAGCVVFKVTQDTDDPLKYHVYEEFVDRAAFEFHQLRVKRSFWGRASQNVERHYTISE